MLLKPLLSLTSSLCVGFFFCYFHKEWSPRVCLDQISFIAIHLLFVFVFLIFNDSLIFRLWYCSLVDNVLGFIQLNCPWQSRQCSIALELYHFYLRLSCWCFTALVMTFLLVSTTYRTLQVLSNWQTQEKLLGSSFDLFLYIKFIKLHPRVKLFFMPNFVEFLS